jgi:hypothetical protein
VGQPNQDRVFDILSCVAAAPIAYRVATTVNRSAEPPKAKRVLAAFTQDEWHRCPSVRVETLIVNAR